MEEKNAKKPVMKKTEGPMQGKLSYEQLSEICRQMQMQNQKLQVQLQQMGDFNFFKRLEFLFEVVKNYTMFDNLFVEKVVKELKELLYPKEEGKDETRDK